MYPGLLIAFWFISELQIAVGQTYTVVGHFLREDEIGDFKVLGCCFIDSGLG